MESEIKEQYISSDIDKLEKLDKNIYKITITSDLDNVYEIISNDDKYRLTVYKNHSNAIYLMCFSTNKEEHNIRIVQLTSSLKKDNVSYR